MCGFNVENVCTLSCFEDFISFKTDKMKTIKNTNFTSITSKHEAGKSRKLYTHDSKGSVIDIVGGSD